MQRRVSGGPALWALRERDEAIERWLTTEVVEAYDRAAEPGRALTAASVRAALRARHDQQISGS